MIYVQAEINNDLVILNTSSGIAGTFKEICEPFICTEEDLMDEKEGWMELLSLDPNFDPDEYSEVYEQEMKERRRCSEVYKQVADSFKTIEDQAFGLATESISFPLTEASDILGYLADMTLDIQAILREDKDIDIKGLHCAAIIAAIYDAFGNRDSLKRQVINNAFPYPEK